MDGVGPRGERPGGRSGPSAALGNLQEQEKGLELHWNNCGGAWCRLEHLDPRGVDSAGVFIIWRNGDQSRQAPSVLYVGHGWLAAEIARCQRNPLFLRQADLYVTWAGVPEALDIEPVAAYLYQQLRPTWGDVLPSSDLRPVNLPLTA